ncbi:aromatic compound dioxygenase, partial [Massarina eburnea CBS 473.64]
FIMVNFASILAASSVVGMAVAHPGEHHDHAQVKRAIDVRQGRAMAAKRSLENCQSSLKHRDLMARSMARRAQAMTDLRQKRGIQTSSKKLRRDLASLQEFETVNHNMTSQVDFTADTPASEIFAANTSYILSPENTDGPYYVLGELVRQDVTEGQAGIKVYLEAQYIDVETCEPVKDLYVDVWNCNATGVYSGVESGQAGLDTTFLRGIQATNEDGVVAFDTIFPGHYQGRATHTHLLTKSNVTLRDNNTITGGAVTHIGQVFFPETLIDAVEATAPYNTNTVERTTNDDDMWSIVQAENSFDPFPEFVYLGDSIEDGLLAWIQIGINSTADHSDDDYYAVAATYYATGGVANANSMGMGGSGGGNMTNGTMPSGAAPSGAIPTDAAAAAASTSAVVLSTSSASSVSSAAAAPSGAAPSAAPQGKAQGQKQTQNQAQNQAQNQGQQKPSGFATSALPSPHRAN